MSLAIIARIQTTKHPNADRLQIGNVLGYQVIVGMNTSDGELGVFFQEGLQLSEEYAKVNDLVRRKDADGKRAGGFFDENRRVRAQKFRGVKSEGYWAPLSSLEFACSKPLAEGTRFEQLDGKPICNKYVTPATRAAAGKHGTSRKETVMFRKHFDTDQLRMNYGLLKPRSLMILTLKMHGTSQRVGRVKDEIKLPKWKQWVNLWTGRQVFAEEGWRYLVGTRNVILNIWDRLGAGPTEGGYHDIGFREQAAQPFYGKLHKGETVYYEVVGYERPGAPIMQRHQAKDDIAKQYGKDVVYHYGCQDGFFGVYVYRITMANEDGVLVELPWSVVKERCVELGVNHVPEMAHPFHYCGDQEKLKRLVEQVVEGPDPVGTTHPREGVCLRIETGGRVRIFKQKSFTFCTLEGLIKDDANYVDAEEAA